MKLINKYIKCVAAFCLIFALMCPIFLPASGTKAQLFEDVSEGEWHYTYIKTLTEDGILKGMTPTAFEPSGKLTAAQLCALITRCLGLESTANKLSAQSDIWFYGYAAVLYEMGILDKADFPPEERGTKLVISDSAYNWLNSPIRRDMTAKIIIKAFEHSRGFIVGGGYDQNSLSAYAAEIADYEKIPQNMREYALKCYYNGILNGYDDGTFRPDGYLTRAEAAKIISTVLNYSLRERSEYRDLPPTAMVSSTDYGTDWADNMILNSQRLADVLWQVSNGLEFGTDKITLRLDNIIPAGYLVEARFYVKSGARYSGIYHAAPSDFPAVHSESATGERAVILYLKNADADGRIDGTAEFRADRNGKIIYSDYQIR